MNDIYNQSHCTDLTPKMAIDSIKREEKTEAQKKRANQLIGIILRICGLAGYDVMSDIVIRDRNTGIKYTNRREKRNEK